MAMRPIITEDESKAVSARLDEASQRVSFVRTKRLFWRVKNFCKLPQGKINWNGEGYDDR